jgi:hypothetical protein
VNQGTYGDTGKNPLAGYTFGLYDNYQNDKWVFHDPRIQPSLSATMNASDATISLTPANLEYIYAGGMPDPQIAVIQGLMNTLGYENSAFWTLNSGGENGFWAPPPALVMQNAYNPSGAPYGNEVSLINLTTDYSPFYTDAAGSFWTTVFDSALEYAANQPDPSKVGETETQAAQPSVTMKVRRQYQGFTLQHTIAQGQNVVIGESETGFFNESLEPNPAWPDKLVYATGSTAGQEIVAVEGRSKATAATLEAIFEIPPGGRGPFRIFAYPLGWDYGTKYNQADPRLPILSPLVSVSFQVDRQGTDDVLNGDFDYIYVNAGAPIQMDIPNDGMYHLAIVSNDTEIRHYLNGTLLQTVNVNEVLSSADESLRTAARSMLMHNSNFLDIGVTLLRTQRAMRFLSQAAHAFVLGASGYSYDSDTIHEFNINMPPAKLRGLRYTQTELYTGESFELPTGITQPEPTSILSRLGIK